MDKGIRPAPTLFSHRAQRSLCLLTNAIEWPPFSLLFSLLNVSRSRELLVKLAEQCAEMRPHIQKSIDFSAPTQAKWVGRMKGGFFSFTAFYAVCAPLEWRWSSSARCCFQDATSHHTCYSYRFTILFMRILFAHEAVTQLLKNDSTLYMTISSSKCIL